MKKTIKWVAWGLGVLVLILILAAWIVPRLVDVAKYKPEIEKYVSEMTGRSFSIDGALTLSIFPRIGLSISDLRLGSPEGFSQKGLLSIENFEAQLKLPPLLSGRIEIDRFHLGGLRLILEKNAAGRGNWEDLIKPKATVSEVKDKKASGDPSGGWLQVTSLAVEEFEVSDSSAVWIDAGRGGERHELSGIRLILRELSFEKPVGIDFSGRFDGMPVAVKGNVGPLGKNPGKGALPVEIVLSFLDEAHLSLTGTLRDPVQHPAFDFKLALAPFSPRRLAAAGGGDPAFITVDPGVLERLALEAVLAGDLTRVAVTDGRIELDDSRIALTAAVEDFSRPHVTFDLKIDQIDLDRYMPAAEAAEAAQAAQAAQAGEPTRPPTTSAKKAAPRQNANTALKSLVIDAALSVGRLTAHRIVAENLQAKLSGVNGIFHLTPASAEICKGNLGGSATFDLNPALPTGRFDLKAGGVQAGLLVRALSNKDVIEGELQGKAALTMAGRRVEDIKKSLNGTVDLVFQNGVIKGIDLAAIVGAAENALDFSLFQGKAARTEFAEISAPFRLSNGRAHTEEATLSSPIIRVTAAGTADLVTETLDFRLLPQFAYAAGKSDGKGLTEVRLPLLLGGTFSTPELRPDLSSLAKDQLQKRVLESKELKKVFKNKDLKPFEEATKGLLKGLLSR